MCFSMLRQIAQIAQNTEHMRKTAEAQQKSTDKAVQILQRLEAILDVQSASVSSIEHKLGCMELRDSLGQPSAGDAFRHLDQEASGQIWGCPPSVYQMVAGLLSQDGLCMKGQLPVQADITRGHYQVARSILEREGLLAEDDQWNQGNIALALPRIQDKVVRRSMPGYPPLTRRGIGQLVGITPAIRLEIDQAVAQALPRYHHGDQPPVPAGDAQYTQFVQEMIPPSTITRMLQGRFNATA